VGAPMKCKAHRFLQVAREGWTYWENFSGGIIAAKYGAGSGHKTRAL
jgi:hypothetical protein